ncbi:MAG: hypothetical protein U0K74_08405, partial [Clostridia bacterium]|nr:hypothetical protein [Clostridia bacterium]
STANYLWDTPVGADENSVFSKNERGSEILGVSSTPTFLTEPLYQIKDNHVEVDYILDCRQDHEWLLD